MTPEFHARWGAVNDAVGDLTSADVLTAADIRKAVTKRTRKQLHARTSLVESSCSPSSSRCTLSSPASAWAPLRFSVSTWRAGSASSAGRRPDGQAPMGRGLSATPIGTGAGSPRLVALFASHQAATRYEHTMAALAGALAEGLDQLRRAGDRRNEAEKVCDQNPDKEREDIREELAPFGPD